jgi:predicted translin family RNA/ssDNA-binding protein
MNQVVRKKLELNSSSVHLLNKQNLNRNLSSLIKQAKHINLARHINSYNFIFITFIVLFASFEYVELVNLQFLLTTTMIYVITY